MVRAVAGPGSPSVYSRGVRDLRGAISPHIERPGQPPRPSAFQPVRDQGTGPAYPAFGTGAASGVSSYVASKWASVRAGSVSPRTWAAQSQ